MNYYLSRPSTPSARELEEDDDLQPLAPDIEEDSSLDEFIDISHNFDDSDSEYHSIENEEHLNFGSDNAQFSYACDQLMLQLRSNLPEECSKSPNKMEKLESTIEEGNAMENNSAFPNYLSDKLVEKEEMKNFSRTMEDENSDDDIDEGNLNRKPAILKLDKKLSSTDVSEENSEANKIQLGNFLSRSMNEFHTINNTTILTDIVTATTTTAIDVTNHAEAFTNNYHLYCSNAGGGLYKLKNYYENYNDDEVMDQNLLNQEYLQIKLKYKIILLSNMLFEMKEELRLRRKIIDGNEKEMNQRKCEFFIKLNNEPNLNDAHYLSIRYNEYLGNKTRQLINQKNLYSKLKIEYKTLYDIYVDVVKEKDIAKNISIFNTSILEKIPSTNISLSQVSSSQSSPEVQSTLISSSRSSSTTSLISSSSIKIPFSDIIAQIEEKNKLIACIHEQLSKEEGKLHIAQYSQNSLNQKLLSTKCDKEIIPVNDSSENLENNFHYCTEKVEKICNKILLLKNCLHKVTKEKINLTKHLNSDNKNNTSQRNKKRYNKKIIQKIKTSCSYIFSEDNQLHQQFQLQHSESVHKKKVDNQQFNNYTIDDTNFSDETKSCNVVYNNVSSIATIKINNDADIDNQHNKNATFIGNENISNMSDINNYDGEKFGKKRTAQQILLNFVALMMPDNPDYKKLKAENVALKEMFKKVVNKMKLIDGAKDKIALIQDYILRNKNQLHRLETQLNCRQNRQIYLLKLDELNDQIGLIQKQLRSLNGMKLTCLSEEFDMQHFDDKGTVIESVNKNTNIKNKSNREQMYPEDDVAKEKRLHQINKLMKELQDLIIIEYKTSDKHTFINEHNNNKSEKVENDNQLERSKCIDLDEVLRALEMAELKAVNLNHQLALKEMELRHLTEVFNEQNNELGILENITMLRNQCVHKHNNNYNLLKTLPNDNNEIEYLRELHRKEKETTIILKSIHDRLYDIITVEYDKKIIYYQNKVDELRAKRNLSNEEIQDHFRACLKGIYLERGTKYTKNNMEYIHLNDVVEVFNRIMRLNPDCLNFIEEAALFIGSQLKRWRHHLKNTGDILAKRYSE